MENKRIVISGAGIAGLTLAYWLKKWGFCPVIVEKHPFLRSGGYKVDVRGASLEVAKRMGIYDELLESNVNLTSSKFVYSDKKILEFEGDFLGHTSSCDIEINRWDLTQILSKKVGDIEIIYGDCITHIEGKIVHFEKMEPKEFDIIVGADGQYSNVRNLVFGEDEKFLKEFGVHFCVFPLPNIFNLNRCEIVYFAEGKLVTAYASGKNSYASFAYKSTEKKLAASNLKALFEKEFQSLGWQIPKLVSLMKKSEECYFSSIAQVKMPLWYKERVVLIGDAAYSVQGMGTSLAIVSAYVLAREIHKENSNYSKAFENYDKAMRAYVEASQALAEKNLQAFTTSSWRIKIQLYLLKILPKKFLQYFLNQGKKEMNEVANSFKL